MIYLLQLPKVKSLLKSNLLRQISTVFLWDNVARAISVVTTILCIRLLSKEDYALYTFFWSSGFFFLGVVTSGIDMAYVRFAAEEFSVKKRMSNDIFIFSLLLCILIFIILAPFVLVFRRQLVLLMFGTGLYESPLLLGFIFAVAIFLAEIVTRFYQVQERYKTAGLLKSTQKILFFAALITIILFNKMMFLSIALVQIVLVFGFGLFFITKILKAEFIRNKCVLHLSRFKHFFNVSTWLILYFLCFSLFCQLDVFMISRFLTSTDLADYGVAFRYYAFLMLMFPAIKTVLKVRTAKIDMVESIEKQRVFFKTWLKVVTIFAIPLIFLVMLLSSYFMNLLNGSKYTASIFPFKILAISAMCSYLFSPITDIFRSMKKYRLLFCFGFVALIMNFFGNLWLIPILGISGAAIATLGSHLLINGSATVYVFMKK